MLFPQLLELDGSGFWRGGDVSSVPVRGVGAYNHHCNGEEVEWRPPLL